MNDADFATCCILSYDRPEFLRDMLRTMIDHADYPMEIIIHDDGSSDRDLRMMLHHLIDQGHISTIIRNPPGHNQGQGIALNRMFYMAKGDPIIKLDHDLLFKPGWLRHCVEILEHNQKDPTEPEIGCLGLFKYHAEPVVHTDMHIRSFPSGWEEVRDFVGSAMVIPRKAWEEFGPFEERSEAFAEDNTFKLAITDREGWACGLTALDLADNQGFGLGPSTVVVERDGELTSREIKKGPKVIRP